MGIDSALEPPRHYAEAMQAFRDRRLHWNIRLGARIGLVLDAVLLVDAIVEHDPALGLVGLGGLVVLARGERAESREIQTIDNELRKLTA